MSYLHSNNCLWTECMIPPFPPPHVRQPPPRWCDNKSSLSDVAAAMMLANKGAAPRQMCRPLRVHLSALQSAVNFHNCTLTFRPRGPCLMCGRLVGLYHIRGEKWMLMWSILLINAACLCLCRRVLLLAAAVWQHVLPPRRSASLHDPADDERMFES